MKWFWYIMAVGLLLMILSVEGERDSELVCGACHMLVDQIDYGISQTDPKQTIQVGSFRIKPDGTQQLNEIPYKRSGVQITELLETACDNSKDYLQSTDSSSGMKQYKRQNRRDGKPSQAKSIVISKDSQKMLKFALASDGLIALDGLKTRLVDDVNVNVLVTPKCEGLAEDYEEEIIKAFKQVENTDYLRMICVDVTESCLLEQLYDTEPEEAPPGEQSDSEEADVDINKANEESDEDKSTESKDEL